MANDFNKEERVAFEEILSGFEDALVLSRNVNVYKSDQALMERSGNIIWRPQPYIARSFAGLDQTPHFFDKTQLSVPATIGFIQSSPWALDATELRDILQEGRLGQAAKDKLASDINIAILNAATMLGSLFVKIATAAAGFVDVALVEAILNEQGIPGGDRFLALSTRDYNGMANNLATRGTVQGKVQTAYEKALIGEIASFTAFKLDYAQRKAVAAGGGALTIDTTAGGGNVYVPRATSVAATGERGNVDNRFQQVTISSTVNVVAGDAFTIATLEACHHITKSGTGNLKTFRVVSVDNATQMTITPPIISALGATEAELQYQNCIINTPAANSAIVFLNTATGPMNAFWYRDALEILPGRMAYPDNSGMSLIRGTTDQGIEVVMAKQADIRTGRTLYRLDTMFGVANLNPEMSGIVMFSQP